MLLLPEEPGHDRWQAWTTDALIQWLLTRAGEPTGRARVIAIDGRGASGKSTLAQALSARLPGSAVVHTDDLAWNEPFFGWGHLLADVLATIHRGEQVAFQPPAWPEHGRDGAIVVPADATTVIIEGTGALQRDLVDLIDASVWVQSDWEQAERRGLARDIASGVNGDAARARRFWDEWMGHEVRSMAQQRPWALADLVVAGTPTIPLAADQWAVAEPQPGV